MAHNLLGWMRGPRAHGERGETRRRLALKRSEKVATASTDATRRGSVRALLPFAALMVAFPCACEEMDAECTQPILQEGGADLRVLSYNIGNGNREGPYALRIADRAYEDHIGAKIRELAPDIVFLQEVLTPNRCATFDEDDPERTCFEWRSRPAPVERLLGDDYSIACDSNQHVECIGVKRSFGRIRGLRDGEFGLSAAETQSLPGIPCDYLAGKCDGASSDCDSESSISTAVVETEGGAIRVIHVHPTAIGKTCLQRQLEQAFDLADDLPTVIGGDWNFDPSRFTDLAATALAADWIGEEKRFHNHAGFVGECRYERTSAGQDASLDRVVTDYASGRCEVFDEPRLDDGFDFESLHKTRADHFAVQCDLRTGLP